MLNQFFLQGSCIKANIEEFIIPQTFLQSAFSSILRYSVHNCIIITEMFTDSLTSVLKGTLETKPLVQKPRCNRNHRIHNQPARCKTTIATNQRHAIIIYNNIIL